MDLKHLVSEYQKCHPVGRNFLPSGYDCIAQVVGGDQIDQVVGGDPSTLGVVDIKAAKWQSWPFEHVEVLLFSTGLKIKTHNYVSQLQPGTWCDDFLKQQSQFEQQWQQAFTSWPLMCVAVNEWAQFLEKHQLVVPEAQKILNHVRQQKHVQAAKACGAAGADVICVLCEKKYASAVLDSLEGLGLQAI